MTESSRTDVLRKHERALGADTPKTRATIADLSALGINVVHVPKES